MNALTIAHYLGPKAGENPQRTQTATDAAICASVCDANPWRFDNFMSDGMSDGKSHSTTIVTGI